MLVRETTSPSSSTSRSMSRFQSPSARRYGSGSGSCAGPGDPRVVERVERRHPGGDRGREGLTEEGAERLVLPGLNVPRAPVVHEHDAEDVLPEVRDRDRLAEPARDARDEAELELDVETPRGAERGARIAGALRCPHGRTTGVPLTTTVPARPW